MANFGERLSGFLFEVMSTISVAITILYYAVDNVTWQYSSIYVHLLNAVFTILDYWMVATPPLFYHFWASSLFATVYIIVNVIIWATSGTTARY